MIVRVRCTVCSASGFAAPPADVSTDVCCHWQPEGLFALLKTGLHREDSGSHSPARPGLGLLSTLPVHEGAQAEKEESPSVEKRGKKGVLEDTA